MERTVKDKSGRLSGIPSTLEGRRGRNKWSKIKIRFSLTFQFTIMSYKWLFCRVWSVYRILNNFGKTVF
jgi:hypothetical protein